MLAPLGVCDPVSSGVLPESDGAVGSGSVGSGSGSVGSGSVGSGSVGSGSVGSGSGSVGVVSAGSVSVGVVPVGVGSVVVSGQYAIATAPDPFEWYAVFVLDPEPFFEYRFLFATTPGPM
jgi:hypothetical protein